jgi:carboxylesterase type B
LCGKLVKVGDGKDARAYLGVPYAQPVTGEGRWSAPRPLATPDEPRQAIDFGPVCPQTPPSKAAPAPTASGDTRVPLKHPSRSSDAPRTESEDCLTLNVWTPADTGAGGLPVIVYIHGGAFFAGDAGDPLLDGAWLAARHGLVIASVNYRLGVLGFLATHELAGNYGILDQQLAMRWVRENAAAFGGDPRRITLAGQSAGAMSVGLHLFSAPASAPLFRAAIMESNFLGVPYKTQREQAEVGELFMRSVGCADSACLRGKAVDDLLAEQAVFTPLMSTVFAGPQFYLPFGPAIDGRLLHTQPVEGRTRKPLLMGSNHDEGVLFVDGRSIAPDAYAAWAASLFGNRFGLVVSRYPARSGESNGDTWAHVMTDDFVVCPSRWLASRLNGPLFMYSFEHAPSFEMWGSQACHAQGVVCHGAELPFVFNTARGAEAQFTPEEERLSREMMGYWARFAADLDPNGRKGSLRKGVTWPRFSPGRRYLVLATPEIVQRDDPFAAECAFWDGIGYDRPAR